MLPQSTPRLTSVIWRNIWVDWAADIQNIPEDLTDNRTKYCQRSPQILEFYGRFADKGVSGSVLTVFHTVTTVSGHPRPAKSRDRRDRRSRDILRIWENLGKILIFQVGKLLIGEVQYVHLE